jgi:hypothetical protein
MIDPQISDLLFNEELHNKRDAYECITEALLKIGAFKSKHDCIHNNPKPLFPYLGGFKHISFSKNFALVSKYCHLRVNKYFLIEFLKSDCDIDIFKNYGKGIKRENNWLIIGKEDEISWLNFYLYKAGVKHKYLPMQNKIIIPNKQ